MKTRPEELLENQWKDGETFSKTPGLVYSIKPRKLCGLSIPFHFSAVFEDTRILILQTIRFL
jgi:hypothetical protein